MGDIHTRLLATVVFVSSIDRNGWVLGLVRQRPQARKGEVMSVYLILMGLAMIAAGAIAKDPLLDRDIYILDRDIYINAGVIVITIAVSAMMIIREIRKGRE